MNALRKTKKYCEVCYWARLNAQKQRYAESEAGKQSSRRATNKWNKSEKGRAYEKEWNQSDDGKQFNALKAQLYRVTHPEHVERNRLGQRERYKNNSEYRAKRIALATQRRGALSDNYEVMAYLIAEGKVKCYMCGNVPEQVDHIFPIALAHLTRRIDMIDKYVAPVCRSCHLKKTRQDIRNIRAYRRYMNTGVAIMPTLVAS